MTISEIAKEIKKYDSTLIFCHQNPDGDTLSSAFSLSSALNMLGKRTKVVCADSTPEKYVGIGLIGNTEQTVSGEWAVNIAVDCASENMFGSLYDIYRKNKNTISIDHHISNTRYAKANAVIDEAACAINIYELIKELKVEINKDIATTLYLGIVTDTGNFSHSNTNTKALKTASELTILGANPNEIYEAVYCSVSVNALKFKADIMSKMKLYHDDKLAIITMKKEDFEKFRTSKEDTEGFIDVPMSIKKVQVAVSILQKDKNAFKISFRSKSVNVNEIASTFGGGGHIRASGALICGFYEDVVDKIVFAVGRYF